jgi:hypothetical protein
MTSPHPVFAAGRLYHVVDDVTTFFRVLVTGRVVAAEGGRPPADFSLTCSWPGVFVKRMPEGFFCLAGDVAQLFPLLASQAYSFTVTAGAPHARPQTLTVNLPIAATLPIDLGDVALVAQPVRLAGRTTNGSGAIVAGALIVLNEAGTVTLRTPLHFDQAAGLTANPCTVTPAALARALTAAAPQATTAIQLDDRSGLAAGDFLRLGEEPETEYVRVAAVPGNPAQTGEVTLDTPLQRSFAAGSAGRRVVVAVGGPARTLSEDRLAGEALLPLSGPIAADHLQIVGAAPDQEEIHALGALSDAQGYYRLDGVSRIASGSFFASAAGPLEAEVDWLVAYDRPVNGVDFRLRPP